MSASAGSPCTDRSSQSLQSSFLTILPRLQLHAQISFRHLACPHKREDAVAEVVALAWKWFVRLARRGRDATRFPAALGTFAARAVRSGRRLCGQEKVKDIMSPLAQQRHGFQVEALPCSVATSHERLYSVVHGQQRLNVFEERLRDDLLTPVPDQAAFRIDWPRWLATCTDRDRRIITDMALGDRTQHLARAHGMTPGRVSQLRREFHDRWLRFHGELPAFECSSTSA